MTIDQAICILRNTAWLGSNDERDETEQAVEMVIDKLLSAEKAQLSGEDATKDATSDLISRKELLKQIDIDSDGERGFYGDNWKFIDTIESMPSAEPERLTDDDFETIRIHLNAQKEKLCNQRRWEEAEEYQRIIDRFMAFASAQPDSQPTCNNLATDTISRQVAINAVNKIAPVNTEYDCTLLDILDVRYVLTELPSAEPKTPSNGSITSINPENTHDRTMDDLISRKEAVGGIDK